MPPLPPRPGHPAPVQRAISSSRNVPLPGEPITLPPGETAPPDGLSPFQAHLARWDGCTRCDLHRGRRRLVFARGRVPCDVLFLGQAPGRSEDSEGQPFVGPAGHLLDRIVARAGAGRPGLRVAFTNLVCCVPLDLETLAEEEPLPEEIRACAPRLLEFIELARPRLLVAVGSLARDWLDTKRKHHLVAPGAPVLHHMVHPAAILKATAAQKGAMARDAEVNLASVIEDVFGAPHAAAAPAP